MKLLGCGQATPLNRKSFQVIYDNFHIESHKLFWAMAWFTGERPGAILKMLVEHAYLNPELRQPRETLIFPSGNRKDRQTREVPTHRELGMLLKGYQPPKSGVLFASSIIEGRGLTVKALDKSLRRALKRAGLENGGYSLYSPRRGFITELHRAGMDIKVIQSLTGHRSLSSLGRYIDVTDEQRRSAIANL
jgi:integrase/recombinase XerD